MAPIDLAAFRAAQAQKNAALLGSLNVILPAAPAIPADHTRADNKPRIVKPKARSRKPIPAGIEEEIKAREARGCRSSGRLRNAQLGLTVKREQVQFYAGSDSEEAGYYEDGAFIRSEGGSAPKKIGKRKYDPKRIGAIPGVEVNRICRTRMEWSTLSVHSATVAGICNGKVVQGAPVVASICTGGGNYGDADTGETLTYSGSGGRDLKGTDKNPKNLRTAPQTSHMRWDENPRNAALLHSVTTRTPIRVLRSYKGSGPYAPVEGYIYSGLYVAVKAWIDKNEQNLDICRVALVRMPGQPPLAIHPDRTHMVSDIAGPLEIAEPAETASSSARSRTQSSTSEETMATSPEPPSRKRSARNLSTEHEPAKRRRPSPGPNS